MTYRVCVLGMPRSGTTFIERHILERVENLDTLSNDKDTGWSKHSAPTRLQPPPGGRSVDAWVCATKSPVAWAVSLARYMRDMSSLEHGSKWIVVGRWIESWSNFHASLMNLDVSNDWGTPIITARYESFLHNPTGATNKLLGMLNTRLGTTDIPARDDVHLPDTYLTSRHRDEHGRDLNDEPFDRRYYTDKKYLNDIAPSLVHNIWGWLDNPYGRSIVEWAGYVDDLEEHAQEMVP